MSTIEAAGGCIPHSRPTLAAGDAQAVAGAVASGTLTGGPRVREFERRLAAQIGRREAVALVSGSAALHLALRAIGVRPGYQVALPSFACVSLLQAVRRAGAEPVLADCDPRSFTIDPDDLRRRITPRTRAVIAVHTFGLPARVDALAQPGLPVIEDAATGLGGALGRRKLGSGGRLGVVSFNATKMMTTGGGGAVVGDDPGLMYRVADAVDYDERGDSAVRYNERMNEIAAALGLAQLERLGEFVERRAEIAAIYCRELAASGLLLPATESEARPSWHRFVVRVPGGADEIRARLVSRGVASPRPIHRCLHTVLGQSGFAGSELAYREALSLPIYPTLTDDEVGTVVREVLACLN